MEFHPSPRGAAGIGYKRLEEKKELPMRWEKSACVLNERESGPLEDVKIKYIYEGAWISRMIVSFFILVRKLRKK